MAGYQFFYGDQTGVEYVLNDLDRSCLTEGGMTGFGALRADVPTARRPYRDGGLLLGRPYTPPRIMGVSIDALFDTHEELIVYMRAMASNLSPYKDQNHLGYLRHTTPDGLQRKIDCWMVEFPDPVFDGAIYAVLPIVFYAPYPFFYDPNIKRVTFGLATPGGLAFPLVLTSGFLFSVSDVDSYNTAFNEGDIETWPVIRVLGPCTNPTIVNTTTGKTMALTKVLDAGDYVDIDMDNATINWWDDSAGTTTSLMALMSATSVFFPLVKGENTIHVTMTGVTTGSLILTWYNRFQTGL